MNIPDKSGPVATLAMHEMIANIGVYESGGNNLGQFVRAYQLSTTPVVPKGQPWCAAAVVFRQRAAAHELGVNLPDDFCRSGYVPDWVNYAKEKGLWIGRDSHSPQSLGLLVKPGFLVAYDFANIGECHHIGIVTAVVMSSYFNTVEGNTQPEHDAPVVRDGNGKAPDGIYAKRRLITSLGAGGGFIAMPL